MNLKVSQCPCSWGVETPDAASNPSWASFLDEVAGAGYDGVELGPLGYLPVDLDELSGALAERGLRLSAGYVMEPLVERGALERTLARTRETARILHALGAERLVLIDALHPERSATSGRSADAPRLDEERFATLVDTVRAVTRIATDELGLTAVFHHHVGTYVEFRDELDRLMAATDVRLCVDSGHAFYAGIDPLELLRDYGERVGYLHLKDVDLAVHEAAARDGLRFEEAVDRGIFCPVGSGAVDYPALFAQLERAGYDGWVAVEQDRDALEPASTLAAEDARRSMDFIRGAGVR